ncbi:hypothetical protein GJU41_03015 [Bacillus idriensis]|uniref:Uncharacterized protein n=1 Tax=Metabacillus idriensis TaxID=324768 RepID=A0A6I2M6C6_9BACI|nr:hypothetical protein [Metabacillus idriensis]MRX52932.1 hypothetical protein [Metabacillus idriensis]
MAKKKTAVEQMATLHKKHQDIKADYAEALERAEGEVIKLKAEIAEGEENLKETYKSYVLNIVSLEAYQAEKKIFDDKKSILSVAEKKVTDIDLLETQEIHKLLQEVKIIADDYEKECFVEFIKQNKKLRQLKVDYLKAITEVAEEVKPITQYHLFHGSLEQELGLTYYNLRMVPGADGLFLAPEGSIGRKFINVSQEEVLAAYQRGHIPKDLLEAIEA